jgi:hypothetical protein
MPERSTLNLETLAAFHGDAWARRVLRKTPLGRLPSANHPWPGLFSEARKIAATLGRPRLLLVLAAIIQERARMAWNLKARP